VTDGEEKGKWVVQILTSHLDSTSVTRKTTVYMVLLQWMKLCRSDTKAHFPHVEFKCFLYDVINDVNIKNVVFDETVPLLAELNKLNTEFLSQLVCNDLEPIKNHAAANGLESFTLNSSDAQNLVCGWSRLETSTKQLMEECLTDE